MNPTPPDSPADVMDAAADLEQAAHAALIGLLAAGHQPSQSTVDQAFQAAACFIGSSAAIRARMLAGDTVAQAVEAVDRANNPRGMAGAAPATKPGGR